MNDEQFTWYWKGIYALIDQLLNSIDEDESLKFREFRSFLIGEVERMVKKRKEFEES